MSDEQHPVECGRLDLTQEERIRALEYALACLWDQVWWMHLPAEKRASYMTEGFTDPIERFYGFSFQEQAKAKK